MREGSLLGREGAVDMSPAAEAHYMSCIAALSPLERLQRGFALSAFARAVAETGARRAAGPDAPADAVRVALLCRMYGQDEGRRIAALFARPV